MFSCMKIKLPLYMPRKRRGDVDVNLHSCLTSALKGGDWLASLPCRFM